MSNSQTTSATPTNTYPTSWVDVYHIFMDIADKVLDAVEDHDLAHRLIAQQVESIYSKHQGTPVWDHAYERWIEPSDDDEEV